MICIENIGTYIPIDYESNFDKKNRFKINDSFIKKLGVERVTRKKITEETSDLCVKSFENLQAKTAISVSDIDCIVVCTQNPDGNGIPHTSAIVHAKLDMLEQCACFDISLGCSGYIYGLSIIKSFMESNGFKNGLLFTADPYSKIVNPDDKNTVLLFGDGATVTHLKQNNTKLKRFVCEQFCFNTNGKAGNALHNKNGFIEMDGRAIFKLAINHAPLQINQLLKSRELAQKDIDLFLLHQGSSFLVDNLRIALNLPENKVPIMLANYGNTVSSSIPIILEDYLFEDQFDNIVLSGFGVGLSWASCLLTKI